MPVANNHSSTQPSVPYWRLSSFYFVYFAVLGTLFPYWSLYFQSRGFDPRQIGWLLGAMMACKVVAPNIWAWLADHSGRRLGIMRLGSLLACLCFAGLFLTPDFAWSLAIILSFSFFWNAVLPQQESITLGFLAHSPERYSLIRLWGSVGFIVTVVVVGGFVGEGQIALMPLFGFAFLVLVVTTSLTIPGSKPQPNAQSEQGVWAILCRWPVIVFLLGGLLMQMGHGAYYGFFSIHLQDLGYSELAIGLIWAVGVVAEILLFLLMQHLLPRFGVKPILLASLLLAVLRWLLIGYWADQLFWLLVAQSLHAFTFGTFHSAAIEGIRRMFGRTHQSKGQALYSATSFGLGGAIGSVTAGQIWHLGAGFTYTLSALASLAGFVVVAAWYKEKAWSQCS